MEKNHLAQTYPGIKHSNSNFSNDNILSQTLRKKFTSPSSFLDHYSTLKRKVTSSSDQMDHSISVQGRINLSENLRNSLEQNADFEKGFTNRKAKLDQKESIKMAYEYHDFCNDFLSKSQNIRQSVNDISESISSRSEFLHELQTSLNDFEISNYLSEMDSEIQELIRVQSKKEIPFSNEKEKESDEEF